MDCGTEIYYNEEQDTHRYPALYICAELDAQVYGI